MPFIIKVLLLAAKSKRGRELLFAGALGAYELSRSAKAREVYERVWREASDPDRREAALAAARKLASRVRSRSG